jgi:hypothetical protein
MANTERESQRAPGSRGSEWAIALGVFAASLAYFRLSLHLTLELRDEGCLFYTIARVANGAIPHRDFIDIYGPGVYAVTAPVFHLFGDEILPVRWFLACIRAGAMSVGYLIVRELAPRSFALLGTFFAVAFWGRVIWNLNAPYAALFTIPLCMVALLLVLRGLSEGSGRLLFAAGIASGAAVLFKQSLAGITGYGMALAIAASALLEASGRDGEGTGRLPVLGLWLLAGALVAAPFARFMSEFDYVLHLMPIHLLVVCVGIGALRGGDGRAAAAAARVLQPRLPRPSADRCGAVPVLGEPRRPRLRHVRAAAAAAELLPADRWAARGERGACRIARRPRLRRSAASAPRSALRRRTRARRIGARGRGSARAGRVSGPLRRPRER